MTGPDPSTKRCYEKAASHRVGQYRWCMNKTKDPSGKCWRHR